jgi:hypothetical protein
MLLLLLFINSIFATEYELPYCILQNKNIEKMQFQIRSDYVKERLTKIFVIDKFQDIYFDVIIKNSEFSIVLRGIDAKYINLQSEFEKVFDHILDGLFLCNDSVFKIQNIKFLKNENKDKLYELVQINVINSLGKTIYKIDEKKRLTGIYNSEKKETEMVKFEYKSLANLNFPLLTKLTYIQEEKGESKRVTSEIDYNKVNGILVPFKYYVTMKSRKKHPSQNEQISYIRQDVLEFTKYKILIKNDNSKKTDNSKKIIH